VNQFYLTVTVNRLYFKRRVMLLFILIWNMHVAISFWQFFAYFYMCTIRSKLSQFTKHTLYHKRVGNVDELVQVANCFCDLERSTQTVEKITCLYKFASLFST